MENKVKVKKENKLIKFEKENDFKFSQNKAIAKVQKYFKFDTLNATFKKEIIGGFVTFLAMAYILSVNPNILSSSSSIVDPSNPDLNMNSFGIFFATAVTSFIGTMIIGLFANIPLAISCSMGVNAMFTYNVANTGGLGYEGALIATFFSQLIFVVFSVTPLRAIIIKAIPKGLILAVGVAIGFFITYVGITGMGWLEEQGGLPVAKIANLKTNYPLILLGMGTLAIILLLHFKNIPGAPAIAIGSVFILVLILANTLPSDYELITTGGLSSANFRLAENSWNYDFAGFSLNIKNTWTQFINKDIWTSPIIYISIFIFMFMNFFDATGTLAAATIQLNKTTNQEFEISQKALIADSVSGVFGATLGTSPTGVFIESSSGIQQGARTGFASIITAMLFLLSIVLFPIFNAIPQCITSAALMFVGIMMISEITEVEWKKPEYAISTFMTIMFMLVTYTIADGIAIGFLTYVFIMTITGKFKQVPIVIWSLSVVFLAYFIAYGFIQ